MIKYNLDYWDYVCLETLKIKIPDLLNDLSEFT